MNRKFACALAILLASAMPRIADAADFFIMDVNSDDPDAPFATVLDPASIVTEPNGNRTFRYAMIYPVNEVNDFAMEADCSTARWRQTHGTFTSNLGEVTEDNDAKDWETLNDGTNGAYMHKTVCDYPSNQPTGDQVFQADDYQTMIKRISINLTMDNGE